MKAIDDQGELGLSNTVNFDCIADITRSLTTVLNCWLLLLMSSSNRTMVGKNCRNLVINFAPSIEPPLPIYCSYYNKSYNYIID
jgi:hypothetical protein